MNLFELFVKVGVDDQASSKLNGITSKLGKGLATAAKIGTAAVGAAATGIAALTGAAVKNYAEYEQLVGGVETLFKDSADTVKQYASEAYRSAGLSANEYMSTVTGFSASLLQSLGRGAQQDLDALEESLDAQYKAAKQNYDDQYDAAKKSWDDKIALAKKMKKANVDVLISQRDEELKALKRSNESGLASMKKANEQRLKDAETANNKSVVTAKTQKLAADLANQTVIDMADNAAKMGNSMESVMDAYRGFSKDNFTMLDNLALGYQGNRTEAERLVKDAAAMTDIQKELGITIDANSLSFDNFVQAIHVVQTSMGIAGTTALEAGRTISGSVGAMKAAWTNLVTGIADKNADLEGLVGDFVTTIVGDGTENNLGVLGNILPAVKTALNGASTLVSEMIPIIVNQIPSIIKDNLPILTKASVSIVKSLVDGISDNQEMLVDTVFETVVFLTESFIEMLPQIVQLGLDLIVSLANGIAESLPELIPTIVSVVLQIVQTLTNPETLTSLVSAALTLILAITQGLLSEESINALVDAVFVLIENMTTFMTSPENLGMLVSTGWDLIVAVADGITSAKDRLKQKFVELLIKIPKWAKEQDWKQIGLDIVEGMKTGIAKAWESLTTWFKNLFGDLIGIAKKILGIASPSKVFRRLGSWSAEGFGVGFDDAFGDVERDVENALDFSGTTFGVDAYGTYSGGGMLGGVGGTTFGTVNINIEGYNAQDDDELAEMIAEKLQIMTERRGAVFA